MCDSDIKGGVKPSCPVGEEHIGWSTVVARKESSALFQGSKASSGSSVKDGVAHCIVPDDAFSTCSTYQAVVAQDITCSATVWTRARLVVHWQAQPKLAGNNKLSTSQVKTKGGQRGAVQPCSSLRKAKRRQAEIRIKICHQCKAGPVPTNKEAISKSNDGLRLHISSLIIVVYMLIELAFFT